MNEQMAFFIMEIIGTAAFACSGAMVAIEKQLDLLGVVVLGVITAVGGGMTRDLLIGIQPPALFVDPVYVSTAFASSVLLFGIVRLSSKSMNVLQSVYYERILNFLDAVGLGVFTVVGIDVAVEAGYGEYHFLMVFLGVITGVGGGLLRDIMANQTPGILCKHVYACASLAGALSYTALMEIIPNTAAMVISAMLVVLIRLLARHYKWNLPKAM